MEYLIVCCTDTGSSKKINQDSMLVKQAVCRGERIVLTVMCDGMGGLKKGEVASASLAKAFSGWFERDLPSIIASPFLGEDILLSWDSLIKSTNKKISKYGRENGIKLGTTLTAMLFIGNSYYVAHVGDSRIYELTSRIRQLTKDQTLFQRELDRGILTKNQAEEDLKRSILLQCVGAADKLEPAYMRGTISRDAVYMLCCDGFYHAVTEQEIYRELNPSELKSESVMEKHCRKLIAWDMKRGEQDNISVIVVRTW